MPAREDLIRFARRYTEVWCSQDPAAVAAFFSPNGSLRVNDGKPAVGRAAITEVARGFMAAFLDLKVRMNDLVVQPDTVIYHWTLTGTNAGSGCQGHKVCISGSEEWRFAADGLISESQGRFDQTEYERQLGQPRKGP